MTLSEEDQSHLERFTGRRWEQLAADHDMRCGRCRGGMLTLDCVNAAMDFSMCWEQLAQHDEKAAKGWREPLQLLSPEITITLALRCDKCGAELEMPLDAKEPS